MAKHNPTGFRNVSIREDLYQELMRFMQGNRNDLRMRRIRNPSQFIDASIRCFITCANPLVKRIF